MSFFRRSLAFLLICFCIFFASIFINDWLVDHLAPIFLVGLIVPTFICVLISAIKSLFKKNSSFIKMDIFLPFIPCLLGMFLFSMQSKDLLKIESMLLETTDKIEICGEVIFCDISFKHMQFDRGIKVMFTQGITTVDVRYYFRGSCLNVSPSYSILRDRYQKFCSDGVEDVGIKKG